MTLTDRIRRAFERGKARGLLKRLRRKARRMKPGAEATVGPYRVKINDGPNYYVLYKDLFIRRIYHFAADRKAPLIIDGGSNIGLSILYYKSVYPDARIIGFEPDPAVYPYLEENIRRNGITDVQLRQAGLAAREGNLTLLSDGACGSALAPHAARIGTETWTRYEVPCVRLSAFITEPVDMLKLNIEGAEWEVLHEAGERLHLVRRVLIEYHHLPGLERNLHQILGLLHDQGFTYAINDFDEETNPGCRTPFALSPESRYFLLVYAERLSQAGRA